MLTRAEKWMLGTAWAAIAVAAVEGARQIRRIPAVEPSVVALEKRFDAGRRAKAEPVPADGSLARWTRGQSWLAEGRLAAPLAGYFAPEIVDRTTERGVRNVPFLPSASEVAATADLDGVALRWSLVRPWAPLEPHERQVWVEPAGLRIGRRGPSGEFEPVAALDAKATSWRDAEAAPGRTWEYRVAVDGPSAARRVPTSDTAAAATPGHRRARLTGGDATVALVRVETYDRASRAWTGRDATMRSGSELWPGGPRLVRLWFAGFDLKAELAWPDGRTTEIER